MFWRITNEPTWSAAPLTAAAGVDSFRAGIPWQPPGSCIEYYVAAADSSGRRETLPRTAPAGFYQFTVTDSMSPLTISYDGTAVRLDWGAVPGATFYRVYSSDEPHSGFLEDTSGTFLGTTWTAPIPAEQRYYYVTAVSAPCDSPHAAISRAAW